MTTLKQAMSAVDKLESVEQEVRDALLVERERTHGSFSETAMLSQNLKNLLVNAPKYKQTSDVQRESLDMIATKLARILVGNPRERDHWQDIIGYSKLVLETLT